MDNVFTLTEAKSKFSEIINRIIYRKERIVVTKNGRKVAMVIPVEENSLIEAEGLIQARGTLADMDDYIDEMVQSIYAARKAEKGREVDL
jgi:prevent-host-death family protein